MNLKRFSVYFSIPLLMLSFFLLCPNVSAAEVNITFSSDLYNIILDNDFSSFYNTVSTSNDYYIIMYRSPNFVYYTSSEEFTFNCTRSGSSALCSVSNSPFVNFNKFTYPGFTIPGTTDYSTLWSYVFRADNSYVISTNYPFSLNSSDIIHISDGTYSETYSGVGTHIPDLLEFYTLHYGSPITPPTPPDPTPLLTNFINISIDKLTLICDFFTSSYVYLSVFVIFIFYFIILLLRRLK